jgi:hypothetical protein
MPRSWNLSCHFLQRQRVLRTDFYIPGLALLELRPFDLATVDQLLMPIIDIADSDANCA